MVPEYNSIIRIFGGGGAGIDCGGGGPGDDSVFVWFYLGFFVLFPRWSAFTIERTTMTIRNNNADNSVA